TEPPLTRVSCFTILTIQEEVGCVTQLIRRVRLFAVRLDLHETRLIAYLTLAEEAVEAGERLNGALHVRLDEEMQGPFECDQPVGVRVGFRPIRNDEAARELVEPVQVSSGCLHAERMPHG